MKFLLKIFFGLALMASQCFTLKKRKKIEKRIEYIVQYANTIIINARLMLKYIVLYEKLVITFSRLS